MSEPIRAAAYVRVSSARQASEGLSLPEQQRRTEAHISVMGWQHAGTFIEAAVPGSTPFGQRPEFRRLLADVEAIDRLVVPKLDRLGRSTGELLAVMDRLEQAGVAVISLAENIDTSTPVGRLTRTVLAAIAEFERDRLAERVSEANEARAREGRRGGAPRPYGYRTEPGGALVIDPAEAAVVRRVYAEWCAGASQREIARCLDAEGIRSQRGARWQQSSLSAMLSNSLYRGDVSHLGESFEGEHEAIISREQWAEAEQLRRALARTTGGGTGRRAKGRHVLTKGMLRCGLCGEPMDAVTKPTRTPGVLYEVYACSGRRRRLPFELGWEGLTIHGESPPAICPQGPVKRAPIDGAIWAFFECVGLDLDATRAAVEQSHRAKGVELAALHEQAQREQHKAEARLTRVRRDYQDGKLDADDWREQREQLSAELDAAKAEAERYVTLREQLAERERDVDVESAVLRELAALRALVAGQAQERSREGLGAFRAALLRLFERFELVTHPLVTAGGEQVHTHAKLWLAEDGGPSQWLRPHLRPDAVEGWDDGERFPALRRAAVEMSDSTSRSSTRSCWPASGRSCGARTGVPGGAWCASAS